MSECSDFEIGDLVEYDCLGITGVVLGFREFHDWDVHSSDNVKTRSVVVHWSNGLETNTSPLVLKKL